jgi:glucose dehydrogenase
MNDIERIEDSRASRRRLAHLVFFAFVLTFITARITVFLMMSHKLPNFFFHVHGTHLHHLNYGIFLLCGVGAYLLFGRPTDSHMRIAAVFYAIGLALTFDEFGLWLHLGGDYWQRASYDAVAVIVGVLGFIAFFPPRPAIRRWHWWLAAVVVVACIVFFVMLADAFRYKGKRFESLQEKIEQETPE